MRVLSVRNVHQALPQALRMLDEEGVKRPSRFGDVLEFPEPVATVYFRPDERVVFWAQRDYNIAFVLYEALWMLSGRNDLGSLTRYVKDFGKFSDDGYRLHGAYGHRWRRYFSRWENQTECVPMDQLVVIADMLKNDKNSRRAVLQMWDAPADLGADSKDIPCNDTATFQIDREHKLNLTVFCRSNDILWGCYYANAFHFGFLLEYMAHKIGCRMGSYTQVSVNWHGYLNTLETVKDLPRPPYQYKESQNPYETDLVMPPPLSGNLDEQIKELVERADNDDWGSVGSTEEWFMAAFAVLKAHSVYSHGEGAKRFEDSLRILGNVKSYWDWPQAMKNWITRRRTKWENQ